MSFKLIVPPHTPFHRDGSLNLEAVDAQAAYFKACGIDTVFIAGTTGESHSLTVDERLQLTEKWVNAARNNQQKLWVHVGHNCQVDAMRLAAQASEKGADAIAISAPTFFKPASVGPLIEFCQPIANAASDLPVYYYDIPALTGVNLPMPAFLSEGKKAMPNLVGIKYTHSDLMQLQECIRLDDGAFEVLFGSDENLLAGYALGASGAVGSTYNFAAPLYRKMLEAAERGDWSGARELQSKSVDWIRLLMSFDYMISAKTMMRFIGIDCGPVRPPLGNLSEAKRNELKNKLDATGFMDACTGAKTS